MDPSAPGHPLDPVFTPRSVVVVGASLDPAKRGHQILRSLSRDGFQGAVYAVNPRGGRILGHAVHESIEALPDAPDLAVVCTPASTAPAVIEACGRKGIGGAVILAVGFGETGAEGGALQRRVQDTARRFGVRVVGPNTSGILNLPLGLNLVGVPGVTEGWLSLLVQSGNVALGLMKEASLPGGPGIAVCAGLGNEADVGFGECLSWLGDHGPTRAVVCYTEGVRAPEAFLDAAARLARRKPVVLLAAGRSPRGAQSARSHTGAVAAPYDRFRAGLRQAGVVPLTRVDELIPVAETLALQPPARAGRGIAVLSDGGGHGTLVADHLSEMKAELAPLSRNTREALATLLGPASAVGNPVDLAGAADGDPRVFARALEILLRDREVGVVLVVGLFGGYAARFDDGLLTFELEAARALAEAASESGKGLVVHSLYAQDGTAPLAALRAAGVPVAGSLEVACRCVAELWRRGRFLDSPPWAPGAGAIPRGALARPPAEGPGAPAGPQRLLAAARSEDRETLTEVESRDLLTEFGVRLPPAVLCRSPAEAVVAWETLSRPVALKVVSTGIPHKTEAGGVALGVSGSDAVIRAFETVHGRALEHLATTGSRAGIEGILVTPMQAPPVAELLVGVSREGGMGAVLTLGAGGTWVEWLRDVAHRVLPVDRAEIRQILDELQVGGILRGARGGPPADVEGIAAVADALARLARDLPDVAEIEINPLFVYPDGVVPVDVRAFLGPVGPGVGDSPQVGPTAGALP